MPGNPVVAARCVQDFMQDERAGTVSALYEIREGGDKVRLIGRALIVPDDTIFEVFIHDGQAEVREATRFWIVNAIEDAVQACATKQGRK